MSEFILFSLVKFAVNIFHLILIYILLCLLMHCFADESCRIRIKRVTGIVMLIEVIDIIYQLMLHDPSWGISLNSVALLFSLLAIICTVLMVSPGKGLSIGSRVKSFFGVLFMYFLVIFNEFDIKLLLTYAFADSASAILSDPESQSQLGSIFTDVFSIILLSVYIPYIYFSYYKKNMRTKLRKLDKLILAGYLVLLMFVGGIFATFEQENISIAGGNESLKSIVTLLVSVIVIAAPVIMMRVRASAYYKELSEYQQTFLETELNATRQYKKAQEDTRAFRHDVQNNLSAVALLMEQGRIEEARQYINDMRTEVNALSPRVVTGDEMVDSLVSSKLAKMEELGIKFTLDGVIDGGLGWKPMDICTVFANMLDNAIEAASQTEQPFIELTFRKTDHHRLIKASNSCAADVDCAPLLSEDTHITSKADKALHGYGIGNIRRTVEKYGGMMRLSCAERVFTVEIILSK